ncbi:SCO family protein [Rhizobium leucaenae]|uniref:Protein SCO1/2 n=1 Tax=Rhizobium leucaenae TaxID=29450 RepID=A0A7W7EII7_9HYPH|nr:SCO family protein [Rhizobium leucaenae]MBB4566805.1 protein SCO1/2 [Rhizobium leucaenae]
MMMRHFLLFVFALLGFTGSQAAAAAFDPFAATGIEQKLDAKIPLDRPFTDEQGHRVTLRGLAGGKPMLLAPVLHNCPNICGVTLSGLMEAVEEQPFRPPGDFAIIAFGIDPREGPAEAQNSLDQLRRRFPSLTARGVHALTGTASDIHAVTNALGYRYAWDPDIGQYAHDAAVAVLTPDGRLSRWLYGLAPEGNDLKLALTEAGQGQIGSWGDQLLLLCYHYDPAIGRYSPLVHTALQMAGGVTVLGGGGLLAFALLRERRREKPPVRGRRN